MGEGAGGRTCPDTSIAGLLLQEITMAGLHELCFTEEKPLLWGQDAELVSLVTPAALVPQDAGAEVGAWGGVCVLVLGAHVCTYVLAFSVHVCRCVLVLHVRG